MISPYSAFSHGSLLRGQPFRNFPTFIEPFDFIFSETFKSDVSISTYGFLRVVWFAVFHVNVLTPVCVLRIGLITFTPLYSTALSVTCNSAAARSGIRVQHIDV